MTEPQNGRAAAPASRLSITSLGLAVAAVAVFWSVAVAAATGVEEAQNILYLIAAGAGVVLGALAVATGVLARRRVRRGEAARGGVALAGVVLGILAITLPAMLLTYFGYLEYSTYQEFKSCVQGGGMGYPTYMCLKECPTFFDSLCRSQIRW